MYVMHVSEFLRLGEMGRLESERRIREELQQRDLASEMRVLALEERLAALEAAAGSYP